jgi:uncharacterized membrane protein
MGLFWEHDFTEEDRKAIAEAIRRAELGTSGEIRVYFEQHTGGEPAEKRAKEAFAYLKMHETAQRNGVLFYVAFEDHQFYVLGDEGIHEKVQQAFWVRMAEILRIHFAREQFVEGLALAITETGRQLNVFFPAGEERKNELPDEPYFKNERT